MGLSISSPCKNERKNIAAIRRIQKKWMWQSYMIATRKTIYLSYP